jgi:hypothetical protein
MATAAGRTERAPEQAKQPRTKVRRSIVALCSLGLTINYIDRANLSVALPQVASIGGIQNLASNLAGVLGATTTAALVLSGAFSIMGAMSYLFIVERIEPLPLRTAE